MSSAEHDLASFTHFALQRIGAGDREATIDELFDQWRIENPSDAQYAENIAAIQASILDYRAGERGTIAGEHSAQLRRTIGDARPTPIPKLEIDQKTKR